MKTILIVTAHPDDESFGAGILIPKYVDNGWNVHLMVATLGQAGQSGKYENVSGDALGNIRRTELEDAAAILGISAISYMGYYDGRLKEMVDGDLEDKIYRKMVELSPNVVVTFDPTGISNHPDHIKISYSTTFAFQKYCRELSETRCFADRYNQGDKTLMVRNFSHHHKFALKQKNFTNVAESTVEPKLYYMCIPESVVAYLKKVKAIPDYAFGKPVMGTPDKFVTTVIDGRKFMDIKIKALQAHQTQKNDTDWFIDTSKNQLLSQEYYILHMSGITEVFMGKNDRVRDRI